jgi:hypothetical protein
VRGKYGHSLFRCEWTSKSRVTMFSNRFPLFLLVHLVSSPSHVCGVPKVRKLKDKLQPLGVEASILDVSADTVNSQYISDSIV